VNPLEELKRIVADNRAGAPRGLPSWCTAHPETLSAILAAHAEDDAPILVEATCNQVNHRGGYTGMTPAAFRAFLEGLATNAGVDKGRLLLGGDHLGPNPWKYKPAREAMAEAKRMVAAFVAAGARKIHLDTSMACADDKTLPEPEIAARAAELCAAAEGVGGADKPVYVIGTEVPIPGGELQALDALAVTPPEAARRTYELHREAFAKRGVAGALDRVVALVVQPGVDMGNDQLFAYDKAKAAALSASVASLPGVVFEAHSTDFQSESGLRELVETHFPILKVGPSLTFAFREAAFALAAIAEKLSMREGPALIGALEAAMDADPRPWRPYVPAGPGERLARLYGLSDRVRYYWPQAGVRAAWEALRAAIDDVRVLPGLLSQFAGDPYFGDSGGPLSARLVAHKVGAVVARYRRAAGSA